MVDLPSSMPMYEQMASANGLFEVPLKTFTMYLFRYSGQKPTELMEKKAGRTLAAKHPGASGISNPDVFRALRAVSTQRGEERGGATKWCSIVESLKPLNREIDPVS